MWKVNRLLRREVVMLLLGLLSITAHFSWPPYSSCLLVLCLIISSLAHVAFRSYNLSSWRTGSYTVVNVLMVLLSVFLEAAELQLVVILLLSWQLPQLSLYWYKTYPLIFSILLSPRLVFSSVADPDPIKSYPFLVGSVSGFQGWIRILIPNLV
jgi:hypothetical protein